MKNAVFITGFSNWGKTTIINELFKRSAFNYGKLYPIRYANVNSNFLVETRSNDDYNGPKWIDQIEYRIKKVQEAGQENWNLFTALCPSLENSNNFIDLLKSSVFTGYQIHIFLVKYKWEHHAELMIKNIQAVIQNDITLNLTTTIHVIDQDHNALESDRLRLKSDAIITILQTTFP